MAIRRTFLQRAPRELIAASSLLALAITAHAQERSRDAAADETPALQEVVVTGSRIARPDLDRLQPTTVVGSQTFDERGYTDVGQALSELPAFGIQPSSAVNTQSAFGIAQSFVDLYSLGSQRTLTLVDGRRFVSSNTPSLNGPTNSGSQVDLNVIPTKLIDRVETISVGGAPIYGSDAIAGTVNIILKKDFQGLDVDAQVGVSDDKDSWNYRLRALAGQNFADGRGNITGVLEISKSDGLIGTQRRNFSQDFGFLAPATPGPFKTVLTPFNTVPSVSTSGIPLLDDVFFAPAFGLNPQQFGITSPQGQVLAFGPGSSNLVPYNLGTQTGNPIFNEGGDGIRLSQFSNILSPQERINADAIGHFKITDHVNFFGEAWLSETHGTNIISQPAYNTNLFGAAGTVNGNFVVGVNNPFLSPQDRALIAAELAAYGANPPFGAPIDPNWNPQHFYISRANTDLQSGRATGDQVVTRGVAGVNGDFAIADHSYNWEVSANYGYSRNDSLVPSYVFQNVQNALNATTNAAGQIVCAGNPVPAPISTGSSQCAPLNIFGLGSPSRQAIAYITHDAFAETIDTQRDVTAFIGGDVFKLPAGEVKFSLGFENRREAQEFLPDAYYTNNLGQARTTGVEGAYRTNEFYAEGLVPIFEPTQDIPFLHQLELEGAVRRVNNSIAGDSTTYTYGLRFSPIQDIQLRGNKTKSIRAPAITELFLPAATSFEFALPDPCDKSGVTQGNSPATRAKNCAAAGINTSTFVSNADNATVQGLTSGNQSLTSETADSKTYGVVLRPRWVPRLNLSVDYIDINLTNAIEQLNLTEILNACYDSANYPNDPSCKQFTRNAQGQITSYHDGFVNAGILHFQGVTAGLDYTVLLPGSLGGIETRANYLDTKTLVNKVGSASVVNFAGSLGANGGLSATPKSNLTLDLNYHVGPFSWYWQGRFISGMNFSNAFTPTSQDILSVGHWWVINTTLSFDVTKNFTTRLIVNNVFDKEPPFPALAGTGGNFASATTLYFPGILGRTYLLSVDYRF